MRQPTAEALPEGHIAAGDIDVQVGRASRHDLPRFLHFRAQRWPRYLSSTVGRGWKFFARRH